MNSSKVKRCKYCNKDKPLIHFLIKDSSPDGLTNRCTDCRKALKNNRKEKWKK